MKKYLFILIVWPVFFLGCQEKNQEQVCFKEHCYSVEIASSKPEQTTGLMNRSKLDEDQGMLFDYVVSKKYPMWMLNMDFPLDIIWLNKDRQVVYLYENAQPCTDPASCPLLSPDQAAKYVLEINAGQVAAAGLQVGDTVEIKK